MNGRYSPELSSRRLPNGIAAGPLRSANGTAGRHLARYARYDEHAFVAWNTASFTDGAFVEIPRGVVLDEPVELLYLSAGTGQPVVSHPRTLVVAGPESQATVVEVYAGRGADYLTNAVTEIVAGDSAVVDHYRLQLEDHGAFHMATMQGQAGRDANLATCSIALGGRLVRNDVNTVLEEGATATVNGLYVISGAQHVDNHTVIDHARPHGTSYELYKGILNGRSSAVTINTKPELRIFADDVRCTHGATIGQLDRDAIFYLQSRGIAEDEARGLLTHAFARDIIDRIRVKPLGAYLDALLWERLHDRRS